MHRDGTTITRIAVSSGDVNSPTITSITRPDEKIYAPTPAGSGIACRERNAATRSGLRGAGLDGNTTTHSRECTFLGENRNGTAGGFVTRAALDDKFATGGRRACTTS
jgi:hypothetical protein